MHLLLMNQKLYVEIQLTIVDLLVMQRNLLKQLFHSTISKPTGSCMNEFAAKIHSADNNCSDTN